MEIDEFPEFWRAYPRKVAKAEARKAWKQTEKVRPPLATLLAALKAQSSSPQWLKDDGQFIPHASTWLRGERWDDELEVNVGANVNGKAWHETWSGIQARGRELGIKESEYGHPQDFRAAVLRASMKAA